MKTSPWQKAALVIGLFLILWNYYSGLKTVPFHPDESTQIFMSADAVRSPFELAFSPDSTIDAQMRYRLIDAPLSRTLIGWGMRLQGQKPIQADWNWSTDWQSNASAGALPDAEALLAARWSVAWLFPFSCLFLYLLGRKLAGRRAAVIALVFFSTNALILLHTRRAMAESALVCMFCALAWLVVDLGKKPWLVALSAGLAINAKQTTIPLAAIGGLQMLLIPWKTTWRRRLIQISIFLAVVAVITWIANPVFWKYPLQAINQGMALRTDLSARMQADYHISHNPLEQALYLISQVFIQPPAAADVLNYQPSTKAAEELYFSWPLNDLFRGYAGGAALLILTIAGWIILIRQNQTRQRAERLPLVIFLCITAVSLVSLMFFTAAPFQRYYVILVPLFSVAQAVTLNSIGTAVITSIKRRLS